MVGRCETWSTGPEYTTHTCPRSRRVASSVRRPTSSGRSPRFSSWTTRSCYASPGTSRGLLHPEQRRRPQSPQPCGPSETSLLSSRKRFCSTSRGFGRRILLSGHELDEFARRQILAAAERALEVAGVRGVIPTPLDAVSEAAGIVEVIDIGKLPKEIAAKKPQAWKRILGALLYREKVAFVDLSQTEPRARLTHAHEITHRILPWHQGAYQLDNEEHLLGDTHDRLELEAYLGGGHLLFQGRRFHEAALGYQVSIKTPLALADDYLASMHATMRYYVLHHPDPVALLVAGRYHASTSVPVWTSVESPAFHAQFGRFADRLPNGKLPIAGGEAKPLGDIAHAAMTGTTVAAKEVVMPDVRGDRRTFVAEAFFNQHNLFVMVSEAKARRLGRRVRLQAG